MSNSKKYVLLSIICFLFAAIVFTFYYPHYPLSLNFLLDFFSLPGSFQWQTLLTNLISMVTAIIDLIIIIAIAYGFGKKILNLICAPFEGIEQFLVAVALGLGLVSFLVFGLGLVEQLSYPVIFAFLITGILIGYQEIRKFLFGLWKDKPKIYWTKPKIASVLFILFILLISFLGSLTPCTESDALRYHLAVPQFYLEKQGICYDPDNAFSNFPFFIETLYTFTLAITNNTILPKLIHWSFFLLTGMAIYTFTRRFFKDTNPLVPVAIYISTPFIPIISSWAFIESGLTFYIFIAIYSFCLIFDSNKEKMNYCLPSTTYCLLFSIFTGFLLGIKYSMVAVVFFLWIILFIEIKKNYRAYSASFFSRILLPTAYCLLLTFLIASPWYLKSFIYTGNPVYPLGYSVFGGADWSRFNAEFYASHAQAKGWLQQANQQNIFYRLAELFWLPWSVTMNPAKSALNPVNFGDWQLGPIYLAFIPLLILGRVMRKRKGAEITSQTTNINLISDFLFLTSIFYFIFWSATYRDNRFLLPILPLLSILIAWALEQLRIANCGLRNYKNLGFGIWDLGFTTMLWLLLVYNALWMAQTVAKYHNPLSFILGRESKEQYLTRNLDYYPMFQYINREIPQNDYILFIGEYRALYCQRPYYCSDFFDTPVILRVIHQSETVDQIKEKLAEMQVKYIFYNEKELRLYFPYFRQRFNSITEFALFQLFISNPSLIPVYTDPRGMTIYLFNFK